MVEPLKPKSTGPRENGLPEMLFTPLKKPKNDRTFFYFVSTPFSHLRPLQDRHDTVNAKL